MMRSIRAYWITGLAVLVGLFWLFLSVAIGVAPDVEASSAEQAFGVIANLVFGVALLGGLWFLRSGRAPTSVALGAVVFGLAWSLVWFWMVFPLVVSFVVLWFGVILGGLVRELRPAP